MTDLNAKYFALRERFIARLPERLTKLQTHLAQLTAGDAAARLSLRREAHSLVGAAGLHQLEGLAQAAQKLEQLAEDQPVAALQQALDRLAVRIRYPEPEHEPQPERTASAQTATIALLCQDQEELSSQQALLESAGHSVLGFTRPERFRQTIQERTPVDLVVLGLQFEGKDGLGLEILSELTSTPAHPPVIVFSANQAIKTQLAAYTAGATAFIAKPVAQDVLRDTVAAALIRRGGMPLRVLVHGDASGLAALKPVFAQAAGVELVISPDTDTFIAQLVDERVNAIILLEPCPAPGLKILTALINGQSLDRRLPLVVIRPEGVQAMTASWLTRLLNTKLAEHSSVRELVKRNKTQLYEHERQRLALDNHVLVSIADKTGTVIETSTRMSELLGWPRTQLIGSHLWEASADGPAPEFTHSRVDQALQSGLWQGEVALSSRSGEPHWFHTTLVPFFDPLGKPYRYMVIRSDMTQRKLAEQALAASKAHEIALASRMQAELLVPPLPGSAGGLSVASHFSAASGMGGDFHALIEHSPTCCDLLIGDVMGKGLHAAIVGAAVKLELHRCLLDLKQGATLPSPAAVINALDARLRAKLQAFESFVTLAYVRCDLEHDVVTHVGCGHTETLLIANGEVSRLANHHPPLGIVPLLTEEQTCSAWPAGASLFMYSDGLTETVNAEGQGLGEDALIAALLESANTQRHPMAMAAAALDAATRHQGNNPQMDDWTLIALRRPMAQERHLELPAQLSSLATLRQALRAQFGEASAVSAVSPSSSASALALLDRAELVATEVFSNIVRHGLGARDKAGHIAACLLGEPDAIELSFHYRGIPFVPGDVKALPEPESLTEGGLGLSLIFSLSDHVNYSHTGDLCSCTFRLLADNPASDDTTH